MDSDWTQIYLYIASQTYKRWGESELPADIAVNAISDYQKGELKRLKAWLYYQRVKARQERDKSKSREKRAEAEVQHKAKQAVLFDF